jgi:protein-S-isoprenylcysteine O-methyltransferase
VRLPEPSLLGAFYACSELILAAARRSPSTDQSRDRYSLRILWIVIGIVIAISVFAGNVFRFAAIPWPSLSSLGVGLFAAGVVLRWYSIIHLGRFFTVDVAIAAEHKVINTGPYRFVRHPSYSGALLAFVGFGLCLHNWISFAVLLVPIVAAFLWRIHVEERALSDALGEDYREYAAGTKRLIPFVW